MKIGYKGLNHDMYSTQGRGESIQYVIGQTYSKQDIQNPKICSGDGYHYCNKLIDVFKHYPNDGRNRFFKIEVLGNYTDSGDKSITTSFKLLEEIDENLVNDIHLNEYFNINLLKEIQTKYPMFHVGGSVGLFLHGVRLKRWKGSAMNSDFDLVSPYFVLPENNGDVFEVEYIDTKSSSNDFDETFLVDDVKVDLRIDPKQKYEIIEYDGFKFKVSNLLTIVEAKLKYALLPNGTKHKKDLEEMIIKKPRKKESSKNILNELFNL
jgi:hypothetical protein